MAETPKRLKKNISFSEHERDIYEYLDKQGNASAFIKRLILNHMLMEQGVIVPRVVFQEKENVPQETDGKETEQPKEPLEPSVDEVVESNEPPTDGGMQFSEEDKENIQLLPDL